MLFRKVVILSKTKDLAEFPGEKGLLGETKVNGAKARSSGGDKPKGAKARSSEELKFLSSQATLSYRVAVASSANAPRCRRKQRSPPVGAKGNRRFHCFQRPKGSASALARTFRV